MYIVKISYVNKKECDKLEKVITKAFIFKTEDEARRYSIMSEIRSFKRIALKKYFNTKETLDE